jgi:hypothetical protein
MRGGQRQKAGQREKAKHQQTSRGTIRTNPVQTKREVTEKQALSKWKIRRNEEGKNNVEGGKRAEGHEIREVKGEGKASTSRPVADSTRRALAPGGTGSNREQVQLEGKRGNIAGISGRRMSGKSRVVAWNSKGAGKRE